MPVRPDTVLDADSKVLFQGSTSDTVLWLVMESDLIPMWVSIGETGDIISASQYLDLAS